jgi:alanine racemase
MTARAAPAEDVSTADEAQVPLTAALIDLTAIAANVRALKRQAGAALFQAVVKANAYGHGAAPVARAAIAAGADWLGVYGPAEGEALRAEGVSAPILVFGPFTRDQAVRMVALDLTPTVSSLEGAALLQRASTGQTVAVHVKLDTGLNRSGVAPPDAVAFARALADYPQLRVEGIYTHFASAEERDKTLTVEQLRELMATDQALRAAGIQVRLRHAANSAATLDVPEAHLDMVRCGIATYGYYPSEGVSRNVPLKPALSLISSLTRVHTVRAGCGVGYGYEHRCGKDSIIGLVPIGYGDGLLRSLGNGHGRVLVRGRRAPIVGRVSMDQITIDLTEIDGARVGDRVTLIGRDGRKTQTAEELGRQAGTISYDIVTKLLPRVPRVYRTASPKS